MEIWGEKLDKLVEYLTAQEISTHDYIDYVNACNELKLDMSLNKNRQPKDFMRWHNIRIDQYNTKKAKEDKKKREQMYKDFKKIATKYTKLNYLQDSNFVCIIAKSPFELINEGNTLHHCVGKMNYDQKFIHETSLIFFIRKKEEMAKPYVTMEFSLKNGTISQCYAENNTKPQDSVLNFINNKWLTYAKKQLKQITA